MVSYEASQARLVVFVVTCSADLLQSACITGAGAGSRVCHKLLRTSGWTGAAGLLPNLEAAVFGTGGDLLK